jgi:drug/metabolite transporter (DMT)-like permease
MPPIWRIAIFTVLALIGFAANSLLCRAALENGARRIDAASFTSLRLVSGALVLWLLLRARGGGGRRGSWGSALALFAYAAGFSLAYVRIPAGVGALILFGCVQATMLGVGLFRGERPRPLEWVGLAMALGGLLALRLPGATAPDPLGATLMAGAGVAAPAKSNSCKTWKTGHSPE